MGRPIFLSTAFHGKPFHRKRLPAGGGRIAGGENGSGTTLAILPNCPKIGCSLAFGRSQSTKLLIFVTILVSGILASKTGIPLRCRPRHPFHRPCPPRPGIHRPIIPWIPQPNSFHPCARSPKVSMVWSSPKASMDTKAPLQASWPPTSSFRGRSPYPSAGKSSAWPNSSANFSPARYAAFTTGPASPSDRLKMSQCKL